MFRKLIGFLLQNFYKFSIITKPFWINNALKSSNLKKLANLLGKFFDSLLA